MEIHEATMRLLRHAPLIAVCFVIGLGLGWKVGGAGTPVYASSVRLVLDASDPKSESEARSLADVVRGIATSYSHVVSAVERTGEPRDALEVAGQVEVATIGSSNLIQITVQDPEPATAAALANALAAEVIQTRENTASGGIADAVKELDGRIATLSTSLADIDRQLDAATTSIASSKDSGQLAAATAAASMLRQRRETITQELLSTQSERVRLVGSAAEHPLPSVIDPASAPTGPVPSTRLPDVMLGGLAGLIAGLGLAALMEAIRPTVVGSRAVARLLGGPLIAEMPERPRAMSSPNLAIVASRLRLAADGRDIRAVYLVGSDRSEQLANFAQRVEEAGSASSNGVAVLPLGKFVRATSSGLVVVVPNVCRRRRLESISDLVQYSHRPLLGVVTYRERPSRHRRVLSRKEQR